MKLLDFWGVLFVLFEVFFWACGYMVLTSNTEKSQT
jgi:hypothetical protein